jgi:predicted transcriptional regulator
MRTTVDIDDAALERAKRLARHENRTLGSVLSDAIAAYVSKRPRGTPDPAFELIVRGKAGGRFPSPEEIARVEDDEAAQALRIPRVR